MKTILCFLYESFVAFEATLACYYINLETDFQVKYIGYEKTPIKSSGGISVRIDKTVEEITSTKDIEGIIIPGGNDRILKPELELLIKKLHEDKKMIAAICAGPEFLAKCGILDGRKYTTTVKPSEYVEKKEEDPFPRETYVETRMIRDGNIITAKIGAFVDFALEIWDFLNLYEYEGEREESRLMFTPIKRLSPVFKK